MNYKTLATLSLIICLPFLGGCGKTLQYEPKKLHHLNVVTADNWREKEDVRILIKKFDAETNEYFFNKADLKTCVYQLTVQNRSNADWVLSPNHINLELETAQAIQKDINPSFGRAFGMQYMFGPVMGGAYAFKQFETKQRIAKDIRLKSLEQAITIESKTKNSFLLFVRPENMKPRFSLELLHADIPNKHLEFSLNTH